MPNTDYVPSDGDGGYPGPSQPDTERSLLRDVDHGFMVVTILLPLAVVCYEIFVIYSLARYSTPVPDHLLGLVALVALGYFLQTLFRCATGLPYSGASFGLLCIWLFNTFAQVIIQTLGDVQ